MQVERPVAVGGGNVEDQIAGRVAWRRRANGLGPRRGGECQGGGDAEHDAIQFSACPRPGDPRYRAEACARRYHSRVSRMPCSKVNLGACPRSRTAVTISACESRTSPSRGGAYFGGIFTPSIFCSRSQA